MMENASHSLSCRSVPEGYFTYLALTLSKWPRSTFTHQAVGAPFPHFSIRDGGNLLNIL